MKKLVYLISLFAFVTSCQFFKSKSPSGHQTNSATPNRVVAQSNSESRYHSEKSIATFNNLMSEPRLNFEQRARAFVMRQFDSIYIGQFLMYDFDKELDRLIQLKKTNKVLVNSDTEKINFLYLQLRIAWIVAERNKHELADLYLLTLENRFSSESSGDSDLRAKTSLILSQIPKWLDEAWGKKYKSGVIALSQELAETNADFLEREPRGQQYVINFDRFNKISNKQKHKAYTEGKNPALRIKFAEISNFIEKTALKQYEEEFAEHQSNSEKQLPPLFEDSSREPKAALDDLYPSADGHGHISGNKVPDNTWTISFDDGPHKIYSEQMFDVLIKNGVPSTFFWLSQNIKLYPQIVEKAKKLGFYRASHSMSHANLPTLKTAQLENEITQAAQVFESVVGDRPTLFRCPYGACGPMGSEIRQIIAKNNMLHVHWSVDPLDWQDKNPQSIFDRTRKQIELKGKGTILFHDVHPQSVEAVKLLLPYMKSKKYRMVALPEMITEIRGKEKGPYQSP